MEQGKRKPMAFSYCITIAFTVYALDCNALRLLYIHWKDRSKINVKKNKF